MRIAFLWNGEEYYDILSPIKALKDGLGLALIHLRERGHTVGLFPVRDGQKIDEFMPDVLLFWGNLLQPEKALVTHYPYKKAIAFAGGQIEPGNVDGFDMYFAESEVNEAEFALYGKPCMRAFGINEEIFHPMGIPKKYDAFCGATFAAWKRPELFAETFGNRGAWTGLFQEHEAWCHEVLEKAGVRVKGESMRPVIARTMNEARVIVNCASEWGGGQRLTLEAMACNVPIIVMSDSKKNREFVEDAGQGFIVNPDPKSILTALTESQQQPCTTRDYIMSKWTSVHYADALEKGLQSIL